MENDIVGKVVQESVSKHIGGDANAVSQSTGQQVGAGQQQATAEEAAAGQAAAALRARYKARLEQALSMARGAEEANKKLQELEAKNKELLAKLEALDVTQSEAFKAKYDAPIIESQQKILKLASEFGRTEEDMRELAKLPIKERAEKLGEYFGAASPVVAAELERLEQLEKQRQAAIADMPKTVEEIKRLDKERRKQRAVAAVDSWVSSQGQNYLYLQPSEDPAWTAAAKQTVERARNIVTGDLSESDIAALAVKASMLDRAVQDIGILLENIEKLERELSDLRDGGPLQGAPSSAPRPAGASPAVFTPRPALDVVRSVLDSVSKKSI